MGANYLEFDWFVPTMGVRFWKGQVRKEGGFVCIFSYEYLLEINRSAYICLLFYTGTRYQVLCITGRVIPVGTRFSAVLKITCGSEFLALSRLLCCPLEGKASICVMRPYEMETPIFWARVYSTGDGSDPSPGLPLGNFFRQRFLREVTTFCCFEVLPVRPRFCLVVSQIFSPLYVDHMIRVKVLPAEL